MYLSDLVGQIVRINHGGPESRTGWLLGVEQGYLVLYTKKDGVLYYNSAHVKSVTELAKQDKLRRDEAPKHIRAYNFWYLLRSMQDQPIQINRGGPEKIEGKLIGFSQDSLVLQDKKERKWIPVFHIKSVSVKGS